MNQGHLEIIVQRTASVSASNHVIKQLVHVLLVDVNVDTKGLPVVQVCDADDLFYIYLTQLITAKRCNYNRICEGFSYLLFLCVIKFEIYVHNSPLRCIVLLFLFKCGHLALKINQSITRFKIRANCISEVNGFFSSYAM